MFAVLLHLIRLCLTVFNDVIGISLPEDIFLCKYTCLPRKYLFDFLCGKMVMAMVRVVVFIFFSSMCHVTSKR